MQLKVLSFHMRLVPGAECLKVKSHSISQIAKAQIEIENNFRNCNYP